MAYYTAPRINTDPDQKDWLPEPGANAIAKSSLRVIEIPGDVSYEHVGGVEFPDVVRDYGWQWAQQQFQGQTYYYPATGAPDVIMYSPAYLQQLQQAANPVPTQGVTGVTVSLRAPGINEGV